MPSTNHPTATGHSAANPVQQALKGDHSNNPWTFSIAALLLGGTGLIAQSAAFAQTESPQVKPGSAEVLPQIEVRAQKDEGGEGYKAEVTRSTKQLQNPHDVPQAITSLPRSLMIEQQAGSVKEALRNVSGLTFNAAEGGRSGDNMMLRGFYTFGDIYLDGIRDTAQYNRELFNLEQLDVLRGAAAMLFGRGQAGGVINQVSKTPFLWDNSSVSTTLGTQAYRQITGDFNKRLGKDAAIRINVFNRDEGSLRINPSNGDQAELHRQGLAASIAWGIGTRHELQVAHSHIRTRDVPDYGISFDTATRRITSNFSATTWWGNSQTFDHSDTTISSALHVFRIQPGTEVRTQLRHADYDRAYWVKAPSANLAPTATAGPGNNVTRAGNYNTLTLQSDLTSKFKIGTVGHEMLAGLEVLKEQNWRAALQNLGTTVAPVYNEAALVATAPPARFSGTTQAVYLQDAIEVAPHWKVILGLRHDQLEADYSSLTSPHLNFSENSKRLGLSWQPSQNSHYYLSASDSFSPTADLYQLSGGAYPPERSTVMEIGAKWQLFGGNLAFRTALYRADKSWERNTDLESTAAILTRKRRTDGVEFEAAGRIGKQWEVFAGLALMNATILAVAENQNATTGVITVADARLQGQVARNTPNYTLNLWTTYKLDAHWKFGGGIESKGRRFVYQPQTTNASALFSSSGVFNPNTAPAYARIDAMLSYEPSKQWGFRLNLQNLFDKIYYDALYDNGGFGVPGTRRRVLGTITYKFL